MSGQVTIHVDKNHNITCKPKGGNVHAKRGDQFRWFSPNATFTLLFTNFDTGAAISWPFREAEPGWPTNDTKTLTLLANGELIKYVVQSADCEDLDPVIIVDKT